MSEAPLSERVGAGCICFLREVEEPCEWCGLAAEVAALEQSERLAVQRMNEAEEAIGPDPVYEAFKESLRAKDARIAALEQERDDNLKLAAEWHAKAINARTDGKAQLARLREAVRGIRSLVLDYETDENELRQMIVNACDRALAAEQ